MEKGASYILTTTGLGLILNTPIYGLMLKGGAEERCRQAYHTRGTSNDKITATHQVY